MFNVFILAGLRHFAQIAATALTTDGLFSGNEANTLVGAAGVLLTFGWSQADAWFKRKKLAAVTAKKK